MQRAHPRIAAPGEHQLLGTAHADELVVKQVWRHFDEGEPAPLLADDLMAGSVGNEVGEPLHRHGIAVPDAVLHGFGQGQETRHRVIVRCWDGSGYLRGAPGGVKCPDVSSFPSCPALCHKCPARFVLEEVHGVDSTRFQKVSNQLDTRKDQGRAMPEYRFPWDSEACSVGGCGSS